jgi:uncharacterized protein (TIGR03000 family)
VAASGGGSSGGSGGGSGGGSAAGPADNYSPSPNQDAPIGYVTGPYGYTLMVSLQPGKGYNPSLRYNAGSPSYYSSTAAINAAYGLPTAFRSAATDPAPSAARLELIVPANADVWVNNTLLTDTGTVRRLCSPPLTPGMNYAYEVHIRWRDAKGQTIVKDRVLPVQAGDRLEIDFTHRPPSRESEGE